MLEIKIKKNDNRIMSNDLISIIDKNRKQQFEIYYMDNGDLYFNLFSPIKENNEITINREDLELYRVLNNLFLNINNKIHYYDSKNMKNDIFDIGNQTIKIMSDDLVDYCSDIRNKILVTKNIDNFKIKFINNSKYKSCSIRFNTDRSIYGNLIFLFTNLHEELCKLCNYYQFDFEDMISLKKVKKKSKY